jgi:hypothetical protein
MAQFNSLINEIRSTVDTATAAHHLNYSKQTLLTWACRGTGPLQPIRVRGTRKLQWRIADIRKIIGGPV